MKMSHTLITGRPYFKPFTYSRFYDRWDRHEKSQWTFAEVPMFHDVHDWTTKLSSEQKSVLTNFFKFFTQGDVDVARAYHTQYLPFFKLPEVVMMMSSFAAREAIHIAAYSHLIETLSMPEETYSSFIACQPIRAKQDYIDEFLNFKDLLSKDTNELSAADKERIATSIAVFSGFIEGVQLYSSFAVILVFPLIKLMTGMGQIVTWSMVDEEQHVEGMIDVYNTFLKENPDIDRESLRCNIERIAREIVI